MAAVRETRGQAVAEYRRTLSDELAKSEQKANGLAQDLIKAEQKTRLQLLTAPVDGVVQQLAIHTVGGVVTPAQSLLVVVPSDSRLEIEAMVSNRDIGFVQPGQEAEIKIDTFNFTRYGLLHGRVLSGPDGQSITRHGGDGGNQDRSAHDPELSPVAAAALPARQLARTVKRLAGQLTTKSHFPVTIHTS